MGMTSFYPHSNSVTWELFSVQFSHSVVSNSLWPHGLQHARLPCPSPTPGACSNSCPLNRWCHPTISSSVNPFSSHLQSCPASESFPMSQFFTPGGQSTGVSASASVLPMNIQDWFPLGWTGWISLDWPPFNRRGDSSLGRSSDSWSSQCWNRGPTARSGALGSGGTTPIPTRGPTL